MFRRFAGRNYKYSPIQNGGMQEKSQYGSPAFLLKTLAVLMLMTISFIAGRLSFEADPQATLNLHTSPKLFEFAPIFGSAPSNASNEAWSRLFPQQGGFFKHPTLAPQRSAFSVFHQLHCLDGIRQGYYAVHAAAIAGDQINDADMPMMSSPRHLSHCIDLIRQSLMCQPDMTIELKDESVGGVTGFGTTHQCKDWQGLMAWTTEWQTFNQEAKEEASDGKEDGHHKQHGH